MGIQCCNGCLPPKRNGYCHTYCKDYIDEKAADAEKKAAENAKKKTNNDIYMQKAAGVHRAMRRHGGK